MSNRFITKSKFIVAALAAAVFSFTAVALPVNAASVGTDTTATAVSFEAGTLSMRNAPDITFGSHAISETEEVYAAEQVTSHLQVSDLRGDGSGWKVLASLSPFSNNGKDSLQGAKIILKNIKTAAVNGTVGNAPSSKNAELTSDNTSALLGVATAGQGMGVWEFQLTPEDTELDVLPGTAQAGNNEASINWTLEDTP